MTGTTALAAYRDTEPDIPPAKVTIAVAIGLHLVAAVATLLVLLPQLADTLASSRAPGARLLQTGLERLLITRAILPPLPLLATGVWVTAILGRRVVAPRTAAWLALGALPVAFETLGRALTAIASGTQATPGEVLELLDRFSSGATMLFDAIGLELGANTRYWASGLSLAAAASIYCWTRAATSHGVRGRVFPGSRTRDRSTRREWMLLLTAVYLCTLLAGQLLTSPAVQLFLAVFG